MTNGYLHFFFSILLLSLSEHFVINLMIIWTVNNGILDLELRPIIPFSVCYQQSKSCNYRGLCKQYYAIIKSQSIVIKM